MSLRGLAQGRQRLASTRHSKVAPGTVAVNLNRPGLPCVTFREPWVMAVSGAGAGWGTADVGLDVGLDVGVAVGLVVGVRVGVGGAVGVTVGVGVGVG